MPPEQRLRLYYILSGKVSNFAKGLSVLFGFRQIGVRRSHYTPAGFLPDPAALLRCDQFFSIDPNAFYAIHLWPPAKEKRHK
jgi:hypothetical protein